jgi:hypothetical protein
MNGSDRIQRDGEITAAKGKGARDEERTMMMRIRAIGRG